MNTTPAPETFTIQDTAAAMKRTADISQGFCWWMEPEVENALRYAQSQGWVARLSTTQVHWTDAGVALYRSVIG